MGRAASQKGSTTDRRRRGRAQEISYRRPSGANADGAATKRNVIPWRDMEKELAERLAAKAAADGGAAADGVEVVSKVLEKDAAKAIRPIHNGQGEDLEPAPDSGVRASQSDAEDPVRPLTYSMYTISALDTGEVKAQRLSIAMPPPPQTVEWADAGKSGLVLLRAFVTCLRAPKPRPRILDICRVPLAAFTTDLRAVLQAQPWKKIGIGVALGFGTLLVILVALMAIGELTDDVKPSRGTSTSRVATPAPPPMKAAQPIAEPASEPGPIDELDDVAPTPVKAKAAPAIAKPAAAKPKAKKPQGPERFIP